MAALTDALDAILAAARSVDGLVAETGDKAAQTALPAVFVGAPTPKWETYCATPSEATFPVTLTVRLDGTAIEQLLRFLEDLQAALEDQTPATITEAFPLSYDLGEVQAAAYELTLTYPLT